MAHPSPLSRPSSAPAGPAPAGPERGRPARPRAGPRLSTVAHRSSRAALAARPQALRLAAAGLAAGSVPTRRARRPDRARGHIERGCPGTVQARRARRHNSDRASSPGRGNGGGVSGQRRNFTARDPSPRDRVSRIAPGIHPDTLLTCGIVLCHQHLLRAGARKVRKMHSKSPPPSRGSRLSAKRLALQRGW